MKPGQMMRKLQSTSLTVVGIVLVLLAAFTLFQGWYFLTKQRESVDCQTQYNKAFLETLHARAELGEKDRQNNQEFITSLGSPLTPEQGRAAVIKYLENKADIDAERNRFPYPDLDIEGKC